MSRLSPRLLLIASLVCAELVAWAVTFGQTVADLPTQPMQ